MKEVSPNEARSHSGNQRENEFIELNELEHCALESAFTRRPDAIERYKNTELAIRRGRAQKGYKPLTLEAFEGVDRKLLEITPELAALFASAAIEERKTIATFKADGKMPKCKHTVAMHIQALDSVIETLKKIPSAQPN